MPSWFLRRSYSVRSFLVLVVFIGLVSLTALFSVPARPTPAWPYNALVAVTGILFGALFACLLVYEFWVRDRLQEPQRSEYWKWKYFVAEMKAMHAESLAQEQAKQPQPLRQRLEARLQLAIMDNNYVLPTETQWGLIFSTAEAIAAVKETPPPLLNQPRPQDGDPLQAEWDRKTAEWAKADEYIFEAIVQSMTGYISKLKPHTSGPFQKPLEPSPSAIYEVMQPFRAPHLKELGLCTWISGQYNRNVYSISKPGQSPIQPQNYTGPSNSMAETYLRGTPLQNLFNTLEPYQPFTEEMRCTHQWCMGDTGSGKTTYLRHLIKHDMDMVGREGCSLIVVDSKKLIREMRTLKDFAPGSDLDGRLIIIDSDVAFPLNPFMMKDTGLASSIITYMLASGMTELQAGTLGHYVDTVLQGRVRTFEKLMELIRLPEKSVPKDINDELLKKWWQSTRDRVHDATISGVEQRLANFMREHRGAPFLRNLYADSWGLDFVNEVHPGGKIVLVDTDRSRTANGDVGANLFGRLIIALIDHLSDYRTRFDKDTYKPVWCYFDEAQDYIRSDATFTKILEKARDQKIGMTVAHHHTGQIDKRIEQSLMNAGIKAQCTDAGLPVQITTRRAKFEIAVKPLEFKNSDQMDRNEYAQMRAELMNAYPYEKASKTPEEASYPLTQKKS